MNALSLSLPLCSLALASALALSGVAWAQDAGSEADDAPAEAAAVDAPSEATTPRFAFSASLEAAREAAKTTGTPVLVVAVPDWYESPGWKRIEALLDDDDAAQKLAGFAGALIRESRDREVHVRHRVRVRDYPLVVVLDAEGAYLGHASGAPGVDEESAWIERIVAIPPRAAAIAAMRAKLDAAPEDPELLFELGKLLVEAGETTRADALFERMEQADPLGPADRIGEARYLTMRQQIVELLQAREFGDVEPLCLRWRRRFSKHARLSDVLLLQANARFLAGSADDARELWQTLVDDHDGTPAAKTAAEALKTLAE